MKGIEFLVIIAVGAALSVMATVSAVDHNRAAEMPTQPVGWSPARYPAPSAPQELDAEDAQEQVATTQRPTAGPQAGRTSEPNISEERFDHDSTVQGIGSPSRVAVNADYRAPEYVSPGDLAWQDQDAARQSALKMERDARQADQGAYANRRTAEQESQQTAYANQTATQQDADRE